MKLIQLSRFLLIAIGVQMMVLGDVANAQNLLRTRCLQKWLPERSTEVSTQQVAKKISIEIGGSVHQPKQINGLDGKLKLGRVLAMAGGARLAETINPVSPNDLAILDSVKRSLEATGECLAYLNTLRQDCSLASRAKFNAINGQRSRAFRRISNLSRDNQTNLQPAAVKDLIALNDKLVPLRGEKLCEEENVKILEDSLEAFASKLTDYQQSVATKANREGDVAADDRRQEVLVVVERRIGSFAKRWHFPLESVEEGLAGNIDLRDGDFVSVLPFGKTSLSRPSDRTGSFQVSGWVTNPGNWQVAEQPNFEELRNGIRSGNLRSEKFALVLTRKNATDRTLDVFVIPYLAAGKAPYFRASTIDGDKYQLLPTVGSPLIAKSLVRPMVDGVLSKRPATTPAEQSRRCRTKLGELIRMRRQGGSR